jgi:hypothetical protein
MKLVSDIFCQFCITPEQKLEAFDLAVTRLKTIEESLRNQSLNTEQWRMIVHLWFDYKLLNISFHTRLF